MGKVSEQLFHLTHQNVNMTINNNVPSQWSRVFSFQAGIGENYVLKEGHSMAIYLKDKHFKDIPDDSMVRLKIEDIVQMDSLNIPMPVLFYGLFRRMVAVPFILENPISVQERYYITVEVNSLVEVVGRNSLLDLCISKLIPQL